MTKITNATLTDAELIKQCQNIAKKHKLIIDNYFKQNNKKSDFTDFYKKYATGGELLHRGYFCPSPIIDLVVGNVTRGRLVKTMTDKVTYIYSYDELDRLIEVEKHGQFIRKEYIWYENNTQYSVEINDFNQKEYITSTSRCIYNNGKLIKYESTTIFQDYLKNGCISDYKVHDISIEEYFYNQNGELSAVLRYMYFISNDNPYIVNRCIIKPIRGNDKKVIHYKAYNIQDGAISSETIFLIPKYKQRII